MRTQNSHHGTEHAQWVDAELIGTVHDLKSPLTTIALEMAVLEDRLSRTAAPEVRSALLRITRNVEFIDRLIADLLDASAIESGAFSVQRRPTDLCGLINQVIERAIASRDRSRIYFDAPSRIGVNIDPPRIERVLANLLQNALKYAPLGSAIAVMLERNGPFVRTSVVDSGPGVAKADRELIFERHQRTEHGRTREGCGLGLFVSRRIIEAHGGTMGVECKRATGSCFYFDLPVA